MATLRHASDYFRVEMDRTRRRVTITRLERLFTSARDAEEACRPVLDVLATIDRRDHVLLMDVRAARGRSDADYESWYAPFRRRIVGEFAKVAIVVQTASGKLHAARLSSGDRQEREGMRVFTSLAEAEAWLSRPR